jgi:hypothetical protein
VVQDPKGKAAAAVAEAKKDPAPSVATPKPKAAPAKKTAAKAKKAAGATLMWAIANAKVPVAAIRTEVAPTVGKEAKKDEASRGSLKVSVEIEGADGKKRAAPIYDAHADFKSPKYSNGSEILGVKDGWTLAKQAGPQTAVWSLEKPAQLNEGEKLIVSTVGDVSGPLRVSWSPLVSKDLLRSGDSAARAAFHAAKSNSAQGQLIRAAWFLGNGADAEYKTLYRQWLETRGGRTPVLVTERTDKPLTPRVLARGNWMDESGEIVAPATAHFLPQLPEAKDRRLTRLDLAKWLVSPENPLTARVLMNRLWKQLFGAGLSAQIEDLGAQGELPSHPELLDWLAIEFRASGWDFKHMVRTIVLSHTYRQSAKLRPDLRESDPQNRLLASQNPRRLEAEAVRDNALAIAGLLDGEIGGPPAKPYQPALYYSGLQFPDREYQADKGRQQWRRGVYSHWQRTFLHPMLANFDAPSREDCVALRTMANTPQQALTLLNDPEFVEAARVWAAHVLGGMEKSDSDRVDAAFFRAVARKPADKERERLLGLLAKAREEYAQRREDAEKLLETGYAPAPQGDPVELAAWTTVCRVILNLHETITRF